MRLAGHRPLLALGACAVLVVAGTALSTVDVATGAGVRAEHVGEQAGILENALTYGATAGELDGDGIPDLLIVRHYQNFPRVYVNDRPSVGVFEDIRFSAFPDDLRRRRDRHDCPFGDVNGDERIDIYCTVGGKKGGNGPNASELWLRTGPPGGELEFTLDAEAGGFDIGPAKDKYGRSRDAAFINANGDEFPDLYVLNAFPRKDGRSGASRLFINEGGERFRRAPEFDADKVFGAANLQVVDYDGDGREDILVCGKKGIRLLRNQHHDRFKDVTRSAGLGMGCTNALLDHAGSDKDGRLDLFRLGGSNFFVYRQRFDGTFSRRPIFQRKLRYGEQMVVGRMNRDDKADVYVLRRGTVGADRPDVMLLNRRGGTRFSEVEIPQLLEGSGDAVEAIDHDLNGLTDVVVMNGHRKTEGPIELLAFYDEEISDGTP